MWTRKELKEQGVAAFKRNYWKSVIVAFLMTLLIGGVAGTPKFTNSIDRGFDQSNRIDRDVDVEISGYPDDTHIMINGEDLTITGEIANDLAEDLSEAGVTNLTAEELEEFAAEQKGLSGAALGAAIAVGVFAATLVSVIVLAVILAFNALVINPFLVGGTRFFVKNLDEDACVTNIGYGYDNNYKNIALTMFFRDLYTILWSLLFIIPGIVKAYEYRMIPYLLAEDPTMTKDQAFAISKEMMTGNKWKAFVLDLSFLGWHILGLLTLGILEVFYVQPYENSTDAALYRKLLMQRNSADYEVEPVIEGPVYEDDYNPGDNN